MFQSIIEAVQGVTADLVSVITPVAILLLVGCGIWYAIASRQDKQEVMHKLKGVIIGTIIALSATSIVSWIADKLTF